MRDDTTTGFTEAELSKLKNAIASGDLTPDLQNMNDYSDRDTMFFAVDIRNIREAAILALAIFKCREVSNTEITVFNANPVRFDEDSVLPYDYFLKNAKAKLESLTGDGKEKEFVKEYRHLLYSNTASGIHVLGDVFGGGAYRLTYGYIKDQDGGATAQISFAGNPKQEKAEELLDVILEEFELLQGYLKSAEA